MLVQLEELGFRSALKLDHECSHSIFGDGFDIEPVRHFLLNLLFSDGILDITHIGEGLFGSDSFGL
jgi:hypothetical protein